MDEFNEVLRSIRSETGLSQKDFASKIGMKPVAYNMVESGKNQPSYALLKNIVTIFGVQPVRLFNAELLDGLPGVKVPNYEAEFLNKVHVLNRKIESLYQHLISIRILLFQELKIKGELAKQTEIDLLHTLTMPIIREADNETTISWSYENLDDKEKLEHLNKLNACIELFSNTFFDCFQRLYSGIVIPTSKSLQEYFFEERRKNTDNFEYANFKKSRP